MSDPTDLAGLNVATSSPVVPAAISSEGLFPQLVEHPRQNRIALREDYARDLSERIIGRGAETMLARSPFDKHQIDFELLNRVLDAYEPAIGLDGAG
jgi:rsbT co-antagonist protein RsbR